jgi:hypothetical protein
MSLKAIHIAASFEINGDFAFSKGVELTDIMAAVDSDLRTIGRFGQSESFKVIEMPGSVEDIYFKGCSFCPELTDVTFSIDSGLRKADGFEGCESLFRNRLVNPAFSQSIVRNAD